MSLDTKPAPAPTFGSESRQVSLPTWAPIAVAVLALALSGLFAMVLGWGVVAWLVVAAVIHLVALPGWSRAVENSRRAVDRLITDLVWLSFLVAIVPLAWLIQIVVSKGLPAINYDFLTFDMRNVVGAQQGGIYHALIGTLLVTLLATVISVPIGLLSAVYLVEYGKRSRLAKAVTFLVDVMTGIPSIVAGLFSLALFVLIFGPQISFGFGGSVAISLLMIPIVVRSSEEMLRLVPEELREASYALGVPKWRTILKVVIPTALGGIVTGITLAIARVIGETAPLLVIAGFTPGLNTNPFSGRMTTLPVYIYFSFTQPGAPPPGSPSGAVGPGIERAWGAALVLIVLVMALNLIARLIGKIFSPPQA